MYLWLAHSRDTLWRLIHKPCCEGTICVEDDSGYKECVPEDGEYPLDACIPEYQQCFDDSDEYKPCCEGTICEDVKDQPGYKECVADGDYNDDCIGEDEECHIEDGYDNCCDGATCVSVGYGATNKCVLDSDYNLYDDPITYEPSTSPSGY